MKTKTKILAVFFILIATYCNAQVQVSVIPENNNWNYKLGDSVRFSIKVTENKILKENVNVQITVGEEKIKPYIIENMVLPSGEKVYTIKGMNKPGFLYCRVYYRADGKTTWDIAQVGFEPEKLLPTTKMPKDFMKFWEKAKADNAKIPMEAETKLNSGLTTDAVNVYDVKIQNYEKGSFMYGRLITPKNGAKGPVMLIPPGAGVHSFKDAITRYAQYGITVFQIGIHNIPFYNMTEEECKTLADTELKDYNIRGLEDKETYYYKRVIMGCVRSLDYLIASPYYDSKNVFVLGGSQGGGLTLATTAIDKRVTAYVSFYPVFCDHYGYLNGRAGGWPALFAEHNKKLITPETIKTAAYYDNANFVQHITAPGFLSSGYNDLSCPITGFYAVTNSMKSLKEVYFEPINQHKRTKEQDRRADEWLKNQTK